MQLEHRFTVPADIDTVWAALMDPERVAPCLPGATLTEYSGTTFTGTVKVKVGPISLLYKGSGEFVETDEDTHRTTIKASGKDSRGNGTATATVTVTLVDKGNTTEGEVRTDLAITGKPAQFGRGLISEVGTKILTIFADCLAKKLAPAQAPAGDRAPGSTTDTATAHTAPTAGTRAAADTATTAGTRAAGETAPSAGARAAANLAAPHETAAAAGAPDTPAPRVTPDSAAAAESTPTSPSATRPSPPGAASQTVPNPTRSARRPSHGSATAPAPSSATAKIDERHAVPEIPAQPTPSRTLRAVPEFEAEPIDLMEIASHSLKKRLLPAVVVAIVAALVVILRRKR